MLKEIAKTWMYAIGAFSDDKTHKYDNTVCIIRTFILATYLITNTVIIAGVIRHWDDGTASLESLRDDKDYAPYVTTYPERLLVEN